MYFGQRTDEPLTTTPTISELPPATTVLEESIRNYLINWKIYVSIILIFLPFYIATIYFLLRNNPLAGYIVLSVLTYLQIAVLLSAVSESGLKPTILGSFKKAILAPFSLLWILLLLLVTWWGGLMLLVFPGIIIIYLTILSPFAALIEAKNGTRAMSFSWYYVRSHTFRVLLRFLFLQGALGISIFVIQVLGITLIQSNIFAAIAGLIISLLIPAIIYWFFFLPTALIFGYLLYINLKMMKPPPSAEEIKVIRKKIIIFAIIGTIFLVSVIAKTTNFSPQKFKEKYNEVINLINRK